MDFGLRIDLRVNYGSKAIRVSDRRLEHVLSHANQPAAKIVKTIIGGAAIDRIGRAPQIDRSRSERQTIEDVIPFDNLFWVQMLQFCFEILSLLFHFV